jgi:quercetin dioxygenase-like cupin family protein
LQKIGEGVETVKKVNQREVTGSSPEGTKGVDFKQLIAKDMDAPHFYMRLFDVSPGGHTPLHRHAWEHEVFIIEGSGKIVLEGREERLVPGDAVFVEPEELHEFANDQSTNMRLICVIPKPSKD